MSAGVRGQRRVHPGQTSALIAVASLVAVILMPAPGPAAGTNAAGNSTAADWTPSRTASGHPDFGGVWANNTATPFERPAVFGDKATLTDAELEELEAKLAQVREELQAGDLLGDFLIQKVLEDPEFRGFDQQTGNYNSFWLVDRELDHRTSLIIDPPNGRLPPMKPEAIQRLMGRGAWGNKLPAGPEDLSRNERCISYGVPNTLAGYNSYFRFLQTDDYVMVQQELIHHARIIPLDGRAAPPEEMRFWNGDPRGRWDGDTLVVETSNYTEGGAYRGATRDLRVVERFTRTGPETLEWQITFDDPATWESSWTMMIPLERSEDRIYEYACHEGNYSMKGMLAGSRRQEREGTGD